MIDETILLAAGVALAIVAIAALITVVRQRSDRDTGERTFAASTEGETICPRCGMGNQATDVTCISCGASLR